MVNSDKHWAELGRQDPYLGTVKTLDPYKLDPTLTRDMDGYFESGNRYLTDLWAAIRQYVAPDFNPRLAMDFGCSVGRVAIPLATGCQSVLGLDVSRDALAEAEKNAARRSTPGKISAHAHEPLRPRRPVRVGSPERLRGHVLHVSGPGPVPRSDRHRTGSGE
jgi:tRNA/tmRNA/rRNA uracil-C5-methylase (TrmA/RlmC/RlmD family)